MSKSRIYICGKCNDAVVSREELTINCCGVEVKETVANCTEAATEKHIPTVKIDGNKVEVTVGEVIHPMTAEHHIGFIYLETEKGGQLKRLDVTGEPKATFILDNDKAVTVYEYCNLHGLWKTEV